MKLKELIDLFCDGYDDKARLLIELNGEEIFSDIRVIDSRLKPYYEKEILGLCQYINTIGVILK